MKAYSLDLRERVIAWVQDGELSQPHVAEHLGISLGTVENWWRRWRETGNLAAQPHAGGANRTLESCDALIRDAVKQQPDVTLDELCDYVHTETGVRASPSMMCRELQILHLPRKKVSARQPTGHPPRARVAANLPKRRLGTAAPRRRPSEIHR